MQLNLSRPAADKFMELLDAALCSRADLIRYLSQLEYHPSSLGQSMADATGFIQCPSRPIDLADVAVDEDTEAHLAYIAGTNLLTPARSSAAGAVNISSMTLDAILSGIIAPSINTPLHPPRQIKHAPSATGRPMFMISSQARAHLERSVHPRPPRERPDGKALPHPLLNGKPHRSFSETIWYLSQCELELEAGTPTPPTLALKPHRRRRIQVSVPPVIIEQLAIQALNLGFPPSRGGRRTPLALASLLIEAVGQGIVVPTRLRIPTQAEADEALQEALA